MFDVTVWYGTDYDAARIIADMLNANTSSNAGRSYFVSSVRPFEYAVILRHG